MVRRDAAKNGLRTIQIKFMNGSVRTEVLSHSFVKIELDGYSFISSVFYHYC